MLRLQQSPLMCDDFDKTKEQMKNQIYLVLFIHQLL